MIKCQMLCFISWATLACVVYLAVAVEEDLVDFDFTDLKEIDWNYENEKIRKNIPESSDEELKTHMLPFNEHDFDESINQVRPFDWREKVLRTALTKALTNAALRQKFVEVMPILRVLSSQQRLALSAVISAQINARRGNELKLDQVRMMFGNDKNLLVPIVYDIANLVQKSTRNYLNFENPKIAQNLNPDIASLRRNDLLESVELIEDNVQKHIGVEMMVDEEHQKSLEEFFEEHDDLLDPRKINEELQADVQTENMISNTTKTNVFDNSVHRHRRAVEPAGIVSINSTAFVHKLIRSTPISKSEDELRHGITEEEDKLNSSTFSEPQIPITPSSSSPPRTPRPAYYDIEDLAFANLNGTASRLSIDMKNKNDNGTDIGEIANATYIEEEILPTPEELTGGPRFRFSGHKMHFLRSKMANRKRVQAHSRPNLPSVVPLSSLHNGIKSSSKCERFTTSMCIRTDDYPLDQIMGSIRRHKNAMSALLAEYSDKTDPSEDFEEFPFNKKRREDDSTGGSMCQSIVRYARPQKAKSASGEWKYIVNTGQHTQTLRLEKCTRSMESCSYLAQTYRSHCAQVYNYHRLLSWDKLRGLHVDIFKVPTCCSCQVDGYRQLYPPLDTVKSKDYSAYHADNYGVGHDDFEYTDESEEDDLNYALNTNYKHNQPDTHLEANELFLGSKKVRPKNYPSSGIVGPYLGPAENDDYEPKHSSRSRYHGSSIIEKPPGSGSISSSKRQRRPYKSLTAVTNAERVDLEFSPSETHTDKELPPSVKTTEQMPARIRVTKQQKRLQHQDQNIEVAQQQQRQPEQYLESVIYDDPVALPPLPTKYANHLHHALNNNSMNNQTHPLSNSNNSPTFIRGTPMPNQTPTARLKMDQIKHDHVITHHLTRWTRPTQQRMSAQLYRHHHLQQLLQEQQRRQNPVITYNRHRRRTHHPFIK